MELDELKTKWHELDGRLSCADTKIDRLTAEVSAGKITSAKQRLARTIRLGIFLLAVLPLCFANISRTGEADPGTAVKATLALFIFAMLARQIALLVLLARIEPGARNLRRRTPVPHLLPLGRRRGHRAGCAAADLAGILRGKPDLALCVLRIRGRTDRRTAPQRAYLPADDGRYQCPARRPAGRGGVS